jgi:ABC-type sugar transport system permease subunit
MDTKLRQRKGEEDASAAVRAQRKAAKKLRREAPDAHTPGMLSAYGRWMPYLLILPALGTVFLLLVYPIFYGVWLSLFSPEPGDPSLTANFVGLDNYVELWRTEAFRNSIYRSIGYVVGITSVGLFVAFAGALSLQRITVASRLMRALALVPYLFSTIAVGVSWRFFLNRDAGLVNQVLGVVGIEGPAWLASPLLAYGSVIMAMAWAFSPLPTLIILAGLDNLNPEVGDSARVDGATSRQRFQFLTLPLLAPQIGISLVWLQFIAFNTFAVVLPLTGGGPGRSTEPMALYLYQVGFRQLDLNAASAIMAMLLLLNLAIGAFVMRLSRPRA